MRVFRFNHETAEVAEYLGEKTIPEYRAAQQEALAEGDGTSIIVSEVEAARLYLVRHYLFSVVEVIEAGLRAVEILEEDLQDGVGEEPDYVKMLMSACEGAHDEIASSLDNVMATYEPEPGLVERLKLVVRQAIADDDTEVAQVDDHLEMTASLSNEGVDHLAALAANAVVQELFPH